MTGRIRPKAPFLEKLSTATTKKDCGIYLFEGFLSTKEAQDAFDDLIDDAKFPWDTNPELNGEPLKSMPDCEHDLLESAKEQKKKSGRIKYSSSLKGLLKLGELFARIERDFDVKINYVCCNRYPNPDCQAEWQKNSYGERFCVLTLGSKRQIEIRNNKTQHVETMTPNTGDLYVMPMKLNGSHTYRASSVHDDDPAGTNTDALLSLVFFFESPTDAKEPGKKPKKPKKHKMFGDMNKGHPRMRTKAEIKI
eukprot:CAMPEP_0116134178 /NCGR_PEP_ID=MMETSP0329-20121206/10508_1 /TAXON_ID=697910 /ORGANISM="Pseudo-nitzschia arenysensis, Strain B593" /LENGTH=250 /DNA_ID=CAMNT_0003628873 /DNA_START=43 /DNA_END=796 /DNA_ORIENTATION=-